MTVNKISHAEEQSFSSLTSFRPHGQMNGFSAFRAGMIGA